MICRVHSLSENDEVRVVKSHLAIRLHGPHRSNWVRASKIERKPSRHRIGIAIGAGVDDSVRGGTVTRTFISAWIAAAGAAVASRLSLSPNCVGLDNALG
eukprot:3273942-Pleurochrysis_carterae.AAC.1